MAIRSLDEHWDGGGHPDGLAGDQIPLLARIMGLAQTVEVFWQKGGAEAACTVAAERDGAWFDPELVVALMTLRNDDTFWESLRSKDLAAAVKLLEPHEMHRNADDAALDRLAEGFGQVIDAKSPWTHSSGVADVSTGVAGVLGLDTERLREPRRERCSTTSASSASQPDPRQARKLTSDELTQMRRHPEFTGQILGHVKVFSQFSEMAASHHERLDGRGYHRGISGRELSLEVRILAVADMHEALAAPPVSQGSQRRRGLDDPRPGSRRGTLPDGDRGIEDVSQSEPLCPVPSRGLIALPRVCESS